jgi:hypothetical protein
MEDKHGNTYPKNNAEQQAWNDALEAERKETAAAEQKRAFEAARRLEAKHGLKK